MTNYITNSAVNFPQKIGAINNIVRRPDGTLTAFNTDYIGAIDAIEDGLRGSLSIVQANAIFNQF